VALGACVVLLSGGARADPDTEQVRRHFQAGALFYSDERYPEAIEEFEQARKVRALPALDFNIARAYDRLGNVDAAVEAYRRYLVAVPEAKDAAEIRERIQTLEQRRAARVASPPAAAATPPPAAGAVAAPAPDRRRGRGKRIAALAVGIAGLAVLATGAALEALAGQAGHDLTTESLDGRVFDKSKFAAGTAEDAAGATLLAVGGTALVAGAILGAIGAREGKAARLAVAPWWNRTGMGLVVEVR
jgi:tetratricopeptide (TPR) repeat protein